MEWNRLELPLNHILPLKNWPFLFFLSLTMLKICHFFLGLVPRQSVGPRYCRGQGFALQPSTDLWYWCGSELRLTAPPLLSPQPKYLKTGGFYSTFHHLLFLLSCPIGIVVLDLYFITTGCANKEYSFHPFFGHVGRQKHRNLNLFVFILSVLIFAIFVILWTALFTNVLVLWMYCC